MAGAKFKFFRAGGVDQVQIRTGKDLVALADLDQKLWVALSCPVAGLNLDERTLTMIDLDKDGRVRAPELLEAIRWAASMLSDIDELGRSDRPLSLGAISTESPEGKLISETARALLESLGKSDANAISVEDTQAALAAFSKQPRNGDGIIPLSALSDPAEKTVGEAILAGVAAPNNDRSGDRGFDRSAIAKFFESAKTRLAWLDGGQSAEIRALGDQTKSAFEALGQVKAKIDDFFTRVQIVSFDSRAHVGMNREDATFLNLGQKELSRASSELRELPLAHIAPGALLPLTGGMNPAWFDAIVAFNEKVVRPLLGERTALTELDFGIIVARLAPYAAWASQEPQGLDLPADAATLAAWVHGGFEDKLLQVVKQDEDAGAQWGAIEQVEKLARYKRDLLELANNFVSFRDFYQPGKKATFQVGTLYIDQRALELVLRVNDAAKHASMAPLAATYLLYCDAKTAGGKSMSIVAGITDGDVDNLMVGRNGVFYDRAGKDWDATITRIVDNPISVRQAFWSPYKKIIRLVEEQVNKRAASAAAKSDESLLAKATATESSIADGKSPPVAEPPKKLDIGIVAALGVAVGGITAALGAVLQAFMGLGVWMPLGVVAVMLLISGPSMAIAWLKLRRRNLGPLLDANGWAINVMPKINIPLGNSFTSLAKLPADASRDLVDPFAEKKSPWKTYFVLLALVATAVAWFFGYFDSVLPKGAQKATLLAAEKAETNEGTKAPESPSVAPAKAPAPEASKPAASAPVPPPQEKLEAPAAESPPRAAPATPAPETTRAEATAPKASLVLTPKPNAKPKAPAASAAPTPPASGAPAPTPSAP